MKCARLIVCFIFFASITWSGDRFDNSPLMLAIMKGDTPSAKALLLKGADFDHQNIMGSTALMEAVKKHNLYLVKLLLKIKAQSDVADIHGDTALIIAAKERFHPVLKALIDAKANPDAINLAGNSALKIAATNDDAALVSFLLTLDVSKSLNHGTLYAAVDAKLSATLPALLAQKSKISVHEAGEAFYLATTREKLSVMKQIWAAIPSVLNYQEEEDQDTAIMHAAGVENAALVSWLLSVGADPNIMNKSKERPLDNITDEKVIALLKAHGAIFGESPNE